MPIWTSFRDTDSPSWRIPQRLVMITGACGATCMSPLHYPPLLWRYTVWRRSPTGQRRNTWGLIQTPMESRVANMVVALGNDPWPSTLGLARVAVAPDQKLCSLMEAVDLAREHFERPKGLEASHYFLTPIYTEAPFLLLDAGLHV